MNKKIQNNDAQAICRVTTNSRNTVPRSKGELARIMREVPKELEGSSSTIRRPAPGVFTPKEFCVRSPVSLCPTESSGSSNSSVQI